MPWFAFPQLRHQAVSLEHQGQNIQPCIPGVHGYWNVEDPDHDLALQSPGPQAPQPTWIPGGVSWQAGQQRGR